MSGESDERPRHTVTLGSFYLSQTETTVAQYQRCVDAEACSPAKSGGYCNAGREGRDEHPINCVNWEQARQFSRWVGGDLPTEAEWEYAASSRGRALKYPWGNAGASCANALMDDNVTKASAGDETDGCGHDRTWDVCSKPAGYSALGFCDLAGSVREWTLDRYENSYEGAPDDGQARCAEGGCSNTGRRVLRGGSWDDGAKHMRLRYRHVMAGDKQRFDGGFRVRWAAPSEPLSAAQVRAEQARVSESLVSMTQRALAAAPAASAGASADAARTAAGAGRTARTEPAAPPPPPATPAARASADEALRASLKRAEELNLLPIHFAAGQFNMGEGGLSDAQPAHNVQMKAFFLAQSETTVAQYRSCVDAGQCTAAGTGRYCNWGKEGRESHPINCIDWAQARSFARWIGGDLPSEAQWEYAARDGGVDRKYPWGNEQATCERALMDDDVTKASAGNETDGCGEDRTWPVCSKPLGNSSAGLCDLSGSVREWILDGHHSGYRGAPSDGRPWCAQSDCGGEEKRILRSGSWDDGARLLTVTKRHSMSSSQKRYDSGLRVSWRGFYTPLNEAAAAAHNARIKERMTEVRAAAERAETERAAAAQARAEFIRRGAAPEVVAERLSALSIERISLPAGQFTMGSLDGEEDEKPLRAVTVAPVMVAKTEVTNTQYKACIDAGICTPPATGRYCNWGKEGRDGHPVNCITWEQARLFARWVGGCSSSSALSL